MTAESLKPFLNTSNPLGALSKDCTQRKSVKKCFVVSAWVVLFILGAAVLGLEIWNINRINELQREVNNLRQQTQELRKLRIENLEDFGDFEDAYENEVQHMPDEYGEEPYEGESDIEEGSTSVFGIPDFRLDDMETEISVTASSTLLDGKRKARSITGMTYQGVPILDEPYMNRHLNRTRHHRLQHQYQEHQRHRGTQYLQMRQRPEETASPPPQLKLKWDDESREIPAQQQTNAAASRRHANSLRSSFSSSQPPTSSYARQSEFERSEKTVQNIPQNLVGPDFTTKSPGPLMDRHSRVMLTNGENKFQKVIKNPGTHMESRQPPVQRIGRLMRKSAAPNRVTALHLAKYHPHYSSHRATNHVNWHWLPVDKANQDALTGGQFKLSHNGTLTVNDTGLYFVYAQITYSDQHPISGFNIVVNGRNHVSCSVHGQHGKKTNTCYTAALIDLENGAQLEVKDMDEGRIHLPFQEKTFFGLYKLGRRPLASGSAYI
ncbi:protein eiger isoform X2 [Wyeomyia smithii]|uniref:protein eiger isoform X2 n=1 Tax=Wyeomyia smithii TaxID=174621 RepID=UPI002467CBBA|nr:protein eiger isoform X2 [Wyeomyia smithii]